MFNASIITIGDELLIGQVIDTNSAFIAQALNNNGIWLRRRVSVGDVREEITGALDRELKDVDLVLLTGGLGPTADDITKPVLCEYFGGKMVVDEGALANIKYLFEVVWKRPIIDRNLKQAEVPDVCKVILNKRGTAPGMWFEQNGKIIVSMPGVPHEMKQMVTEQVIPEVKKRFPDSFILHRTLLTAGIGESYLAEQIKSWEEALPENIKLAYLPNYGMVRLRLTGRGSEKQKLDKELDHQFALLKNLVNTWLVIDQDITLQQAIAKLFVSKNKTLGLAESCTGGYISHLITAEAGSSEYYHGGITSYANTIKRNILHVPEQMIESAGAVSEETVKAMVTGALDELDTDYILATSGIMGPGGGTETKPVGTVWIGVGNRKSIRTKQFHFRFDRRRNIELTTVNALNFLREFFVENEGPADSI